MGLKPLHQDIGGDLEQNVWHEEDCKGDIGLVPHEMEVFRKVQGKGITNVDSEKL